MKTLVYLVITFLASVVGEAPQKQNEDCTNKSTSDRIYQCKEKQTVEKVNSDLETPIFFLPLKQQKATC